MLWFSHWSCIFHNFFGRLHHTSWVNWVFLSLPETIGSCGFNLPKQNFLYFFSFYISFQIFFVLIISGLPSKFMVCETKYYGRLPQAFPSNRRSPVSLKTPILIFFISNKLSANICSIIFFRNVHYLILLCKHSLHNHNLNVHTLNYYVSVPPDLSLACGASSLSLSLKASSMYTRWPIIRFTSPPIYMGNVTVTKYLNRE